MSALVPGNAVCMLYRRYLKSANHVTNVTIRLLLVQQIRQSFRKNVNLRSTAAQRELILQAHKDLAILEDERLLKTLFINRLGMVSCMDWESKRTEFHMSRTGSYIVLFLTSTCLILLHMIPFYVKDVEDSKSETAAAVTLMAQRLQAKTPEDFQRLEEQRIHSMLEGSSRQREAQRRIFTTFPGSPYFQEQASIATSR